MTEISVIIPTHNGSKTIGACLWSIFNSNFREFEIIVVDDNSNDNTKEECKRFNCKYIKLNKQNGAANARNIGVKYAVGEFILFTNNDCLFEKDTIGKLFKTIRNSDISAVVGY